MRFLIDFGLQDGRQERVKTFTFGVLKPSWSRLGLQVLPEASQDPPKTVSESLVDRFGPHFRRFWNDFSTDLGDILVDFGMIFEPT